MRALMLLTLLSAQALAAGPTTLAEDVLRQAQLMPLDMSPDLTEAWEAIDAATRKGGPSKKAQTWLLHGDLLLTAFTRDVQLAGVDDPTARARASYQKAAALGDPSIAARHLGGQLDMLLRRAVTMSQSGLWQRALRLTLPALQLCEDEALRPACTTDATDRLADFALIAAINTQAPVAEQLRVLDHQLAWGLASARGGLIVLGAVDPEQAAPRLQALLEQYPADRGLRVLQLDLAARAGRADEVQHLARSLTQAYADQTEAWLAAGHAHEQVGHSEQAEAAYQHAFALDGGVAAALNLAGVSINRALVLFRERLDTTDPAALASLDARIAAAFARAVPLLEHILEQPIESATRREVVRQLMQAHQMQGHDDEALRYKKALNALK